MVGWRGVQPYGHVRRCRSPAGEGSTSSSTALGVGIPSYMHMQLSASVSGQQVGLHRLSLSRVLTLLLGVVPPPGLLFTCFRFFPSGRGRKRLSSRNPAVWSCLQAFAEKVLHFPFADKTIPPPAVCGLQLFDVCSFHVLFLSFFIFYWGLRESLPLVCSAIIMPRRHVGGGHIFPSPSFRLVPSL